MRLKKALELVKATAAHCNAVRQCDCHGEREARVLLEVL